MSSSTWNPPEWIINNLNSQHIGVGFFRAGKYSLRRKEQAEKEFEDSVILLSLSENPKNKLWAKSEIDTGFPSIYNTETEGFWTSLAINTNIRDSIVSTEAIKFVNLDHTSFKRSSNNNDDGFLSKKRNISIVEHDGVTLDGLDLSLFSFLKSNAANSFHLFDEYSDKQKYYMTMTMNNVIDLTDNTRDSQLDQFTSDQREQLSNILAFNDSNNYQSVDTVKDIIARYGNNLNHALSKISNLSKQPRENINICSIYRYILETHLFSPDLFNESMELKFSEMDYILYFWGPIIKALFLNTDIWSHWGDTESLGCPYKFRLDIRLLCSKLDKSYDVASGEFGKVLTSSKYYSDKQKLVLNGIIQIDNILHNYKGDQSDIKLPLFQALGFHGDICYLYQKNSSCYVLNRVSTIDFPCLENSLIKDSIKLVDNLLKLKDMAVITRGIVLEANNNKKKTVEDITSAESLRDSISPKRALWLKPE